MNQRNYLLQQVVLIKTKKTMAQTKRDRYHQMLNEKHSASSLEYLTTTHPTRSKSITVKVARLLKEGRFAAALQLADRAEYEKGFNEFK